MQEFEGRPLGAGRRVGIAVSRFNAEITERLLAGALDALRGAGVADDDVAVAHVPGAFELPLACDALARRGGFHALVALGAVIRGETDHYDYVCEAAEQGLVAVSLQHTLPVLFGVLTCDTDEQALARSGGAHGNKGADVALDALRMADLLEQVRPAPAARPPIGRMPQPGGGR